MSTASFNQSPAKTESPSFVIVTSEFNQFVHSSSFEDALANFGDISTNPPLAIMLTKNYDRVFSLMKRRQSESKGKY